jgi:hypothetical protein
VFPQDQKKVDGGMKVKDEADVIRLYCAGLFFEDHDGEEWVQCQKCLKWGHTLCERAFVCLTSVRNDVNFFFVAAKC